ncbi:Hypothetical_protein [Hexamita inflata]|uniref:Hypothetical_protein n=1 Tax=Hexamita inflata TaxID=28002 RepID=A0AA86QUF4_9EUKA|nr:Hypothetical protein HINF_LOCUS53914 [Hexamita inflata]
MQPSSLWLDQVLALRSGFTSAVPVSASFPFSFFWAERTMMATATTMAKTTSSGRPTQTASMQFPDLALTAVFLQMPTFALNSQPAAQLWHFPSAPITCCESAHRRQPEDAKPANPAEASQAHTLFWKTRCSCWYFSRQLWNVAPSTLGTDPFRLHWTAFSAREVAPVTLAAKPEPLSATHLNSAARSKSSPDSWLYFWLQLWQASPSALTTLLALQHRTSYYVEIKVSLSIFPAKPEAWSTAHEKALGSKMTPASTLYFWLQVTQLSPSTETTSGHSWQPFLALPAYLRWASHTQDPDTYEYTWPLGHSQMFYYSTNTDNAAIISLK